MIVLGGAEGEVSIRNNILLGALSIAVAIAFAEAGLRVAGISYPEFYRLDSRLGWSPRPGIEGIHAMEGRTRIKINAEGFRDVDHEAAKPAGVFRVAVLGDSFTEAREVPLADTYWKVMEGLVSRCRGAGPVEVLSFATNGYGTAQQLLVLDGRVWKYGPDLVLLAFFTGNDVLNNSAALDRHPDRPYFVIRDGALVLDSSNLETIRFKAKKAWGDVKHGLYNALRTLQVARQAYKRAKSAWKNRETTIAQQLGAGLNGGVYLEPGDGPWAGAWAVSEEMIRALNRKVRDKGADFWLVTLTNPPQVHPDPGVRRRYAEALGARDLDYPDRRLAGLARAEGIPALSLVEPLRAYAEAQKVRLHGSPASAGGHWNRAGHRAAGEALAGALCAAYGKKL